MVIHFEKWPEINGTIVQQRVKRKRDHANRRNIHVQQIPHLKDRFCPLEEYDEEDFELRFRLFG